MKFADRTITLKDGRTCILTPATPDMAEEMIDYMKKTSVETPFLTSYPDEIDFDPEHEREVLGRRLEDPRSAMVAAMVDGKLAGNSSVYGVGAKRKKQHRCMMGIALVEEFWGLGIGTALISFLTDLARQIGYEQMELIVVADNKRARALYEKCGFIECGRQHHGMKFDDGSYHDEILMYKEL